MPRIDAFNEMVRQHQIAGKAKGIIKKNALRKASLFFLRTMNNH